MKLTNSRIMQNATEEQRADKRFMLRCVKNDGWALGYALGGLKNDKDLVLESIKQHGALMEYYLSQEHREDKQVVLAAVKQNGLALGYYASEDPDPTPNLIMTRTHTSRHKHQC